MSGFLGLGWAILLLEEADSTRTLVSLFPLFINKHLLLIPLGSLSYLSLQYKTKTVYLSGSELIAPGLFVEVSALTNRVQCK